MNVRSITWGIVLTLLTGTQCMASLPPELDGNGALHACTLAPGEPPTDVAGVFGYDLESPEVLRFVSAVVHAPERQQKQLFAMAAAAALLPAQARLQTALATVCPNLDELDARSRAAYLIATYWKRQPFGHGQTSADFTTVLGDAIWALSVGDRLPADMRAVALAPFAILHPGDPAPRPVQCQSVDAHIVDAADPYPYPSAAQTKEPVGTVTVKVAIDDAGNVQSATVDKASLAGRPAADSLVRATILAAAGSTYAAAVRDCVPMTTTFFFTMDYSLEPT